MSGGTAGAPGIGSDADSRERRSITAGTRVLALLGDPVAHSLSSVLQNAALAEAELDAVYVTIACGAEDVAGVLRSLARSGGGGNVTLPHKERAATVVTAASDAVRRTGACNTFWGEGDAVHGDNTDVEGFRRALEAFVPGAPAGARVLLLGAGGAARAALVALLDDGAREVSLFNRTTERARAVARRIGGERVRVVTGGEELEGAVFDLVVNATRLGLDPSDPLPMDLERLHRAGAVMDLVYGAGATPFVRHATSLGYRATDGAEMLVQQGAAAFETWWGRPAAVEAMRRALEDAREVVGE